VSSQGKILLVDDDVRLANLLKTEFEELGFEFNHSPSGEDALQRLNNHHYQLVILDVMLPLMNGFEVLAHLRQFSDVPVLMLSARGMPLDISLGIRTGADAYIAKPFDFEQLSLRVQALVKRSISPSRNRSASSDACSTEDTIHGPIQLSRKSRKAYLYGDDVGLTTAEFDILQILFDSKGQIVSREQLSFEALGRHHEPSDRTLDNTIAIIRRKLERFGFQSARIQSARGKGYFLAMN